MQKEDWVALLTKDYPTGAGPQNSVGYPRSTKRTSPLDPVSSRDAVPYEVAKELAKILRPLVEHSPHHIKNTQDFEEQVESIRLEYAEYITSYDVKTLFTSVLVTLPSP